MTYQAPPPPKEAVDYLKAKGYKMGWDYRDVWREEHARAFTVAKAMREDLLADLRRSVERALEKGETLKQFKKGLEGTLEGYGWSGFTLGPDGDLIELGTPRRLKTIYDTNMRTARAAGQWERIQRSKKTNPFLIYQLGPSREHRIEHSNWSGLVLSADDSWWETHYPPNGWGCKCHVRQMSKSEAEAAGIDQAPPIIREPWENKRTGAIEMVPKGLDPGWDTNAGKTRLFDLSRDLPDCIPGRSRNAEDKKSCIAPLPGQDTWETLGMDSLTAMDSGLFLPAPKRLQKAATVGEAHKVVDDIFRGEATVGVIDTPVETVLFTRDITRHMVLKREDARERFANYIKIALESPHEVWATEYTDGIRNRYIAVFEGKEQLAVIVRVNKDGSIFWNAMQRNRLKRMDALRVGSLLYAGTKKEPK